MGYIFEGAGFKELGGVKTYVRGRGKGKYYERLRGLGGERDDIGR